MPLFAIGVLAAVLWLSYVLGLDLNWDFMNYHLYGPYLMLEHRLERDYFAASLQSYLNPLAHVPHYLMIRAGWPALLIGSLLAAFHCLNLLFVALLTREALPAQAAPDAAWPMLAVLLALTAPLFITTAGSSFADPLTSVPVLAAIWLLLRAERLSSLGWREAAAIGLLLGLASGLKLTNGVLAVALMLPVALHWGWRFRGRALPLLAALTASTVLGFVLTHGYWSWQLWKTFGSPLFPMFNGLFQAPDFPAVTYRDTRFLDGGLWGLLSLPFRMPFPASWQYAENAPVDLRPLALLGLAAAGITMALRRRLLPARGAPVEPRRLPGSALLLLTAMVLSCYLVWGISSRIGRYALPIWLLIGPLFVLWAQALIVRRHVAVTLVLALLGLQVWALHEAGNPRWSPVQWTRAWLQPELPALLRERPLTVLTIGNLSYAALVPFMHPESRVVNIAGQYVQPTGEAMRPQLARLLQAPTQELRLVFNDKQPGLPFEPTPAPGVRTDISTLISSYGLTLADGPCEAIRIPFESLTGPVGGPKETRLYVCPLARLDPALEPAIRAERDRYAALFDAVERACGKALSPHGTELVRGSKGWMRTYFNSLHTLMSDGQDLLVRPFRSMRDISLGRVADWEAGRAMSCAKLPSIVNER